MGGEKRGGRRINRVKRNDPDNTRSMKSAISQKYIREIKKRGQTPRFFKDPLNTGKGEFIVLFSIPEPLFNILGWLRITCRLGRRTLENR